MNSRIGNEVRLKLYHVDVDSAGEAVGGSTTRHHLADDAIEIGVGGIADIEVAAAHIVDGFVVEEDAAVGVVHAIVSRQKRVVRLDDDR